jgi:hypothetical protein
MSYYIGINSTTVYSTVYPSGGGPTPRSIAATNAGDDFVAYDSGGSPQYIYDDTTSYEFGLYAHNDDTGDSAVFWTGANRDT